MLKSTGTRCSIYAGKNSDDGMRNKEQYEGKGKGWACNNHNVRNPIKKMQGEAKQIAP